MSDDQLPEMEVDVVRWTQWKDAVTRAAETRPGLETLIVCAFISAMHHPACESFSLPFIAMYEILLGSGCVYIVVSESWARLWLQVVQYEFIVCRAANVRTA